MSNEGKWVASEPGIQSANVSYVGQVDHLQKLLDASKLSAEVPDAENPCDENIQNERSSYDAAKNQAEIDELTAKVASLKQDIKLRKMFAWAGYWMNIGWLVAILVILFLAGFHRWFFTLPDSVLLALIGTTTTNVLGVLYIIMRYLFPETPKK